MLETIPTSALVSLIITGVLGLTLIIMSIVLLSGRGAVLIAGYNTAPKSEQAKYNSIRLCKFMGKILLPIGIMLPLLALSIIFGFAWWFSFVFVFVTVGLCVFAVIYTNTGNRFRI